MILVKMNDSTIINMDNVQGIVLNDTNIEFDLPENVCYNKEYASASEAKEAFNTLFNELAHTPGVDGAVLQ